MILGGIRTIILFLVIGIVTLRVFAAEFQFSQVYERAHPIQLLFGSTTTLQAQPAIRGFMMDPKNGFLRDQGIQLKFILVNRTTGLMALQAGELDLVPYGPLDVMLGPYRAGVRSVLVTWGATPVHVIAEDKVQSLGDLRGKKIAVSTLGGSLYFSTRMAIRAAGFNPDDYIFVAIPGSVRQSQALLAGVVDAITVGQLAAVQMRLKGYKTILFVGDFAKVNNDGFTTTIDILRTRRDLVKRFIRAYLKALTIFKSDADKSITWIANFYKLKNEPSRIIYEETARLLLPKGMPTEENIKATVGLAGLSVPGSKELKLNEWADFGPLQEVLNEVETKY